VQLEVLCFQRRASRFGRLCVEGSLSACCCGPLLASGPVATTDRSAQTCLAEESYTARAHNDDVSPVQCMGKTRAPLPALVSNIARATVNVMVHAWVCSVACHLSLSLSLSLPVMTLEASEMAARLHGKVLGANAIPPSDRQQM